MDMIQFEQKLIQPDDTRMILRDIRIRRIDLPAITAAVCFVLAGGCGLLIATTFESPWPVFIARMLGAVCLLIGLAIAAAYAFILYKLEQIRKATQEKLPPTTTRSETVTLDSEKLVVDTEEGKKIAFDLSECLGYIRTPRWLMVIGPTDDCTSAIIFRRSFDNQAGYRAFEHSLRAAGLARLTFGDFARHLAKAYPDVQGEAEASENAADRSDNES